MKTIIIPLFKQVSLLFVVIFFMPNIAVSQIDTTSYAVKDSTNVAKTGQESKKGNKEEKRKKSGVFMAYGGVTFNQLSTSNTYESVITPGWSLGAAYKHGRFFYWQIGARYNNAVYGLNLADQTTDSIQDNLFSVKDIDIPVTAGLNLLYFTGKALGLRVYVSAVPAFVIGVGNSDYTNFSKDNVNSFNFYGQGGVGLDVLFLSIDAGYNFGLTDVFQNEQSTPGQIYVNLGFRF